MAACASVVPQRCQSLEIHAQPPQKIEFFHLCLSFTSCKFNVPYGDPTIISWCLYLQQTKQCIKNNAQKYLFQGINSFFPTLKAFLIPSKCLSINKIYFLFKISVCKVVSENNLTLVRPSESAAMDSLHRKSHQSRVGVWVHKKCGINCRQVKLLCY